MKTWNLYWYGPVAAIRPYLLIKGFLLLLAFDAWTLMIHPGARYGAGQFNVAHFAWLDAIHPVPTPGWYVGLIILIGWLALTMVLTKPNRWTVTALCLLYTYAWSMSLLDRYQHHYFISLVLFCFIFFPMVIAADRRAETSKGPRTDDGAPAWSYRLLGATLAIIYVYTAIAKMDPQWRGGLTLKLIAEDRIVFVWLGAMAGHVGIPDATFWAVLAAGVIWLELVLAAGYALAPVLTAVAPHRSHRVWSIGVWIVAMVLHAGNELLALNIGWFSYYMILLACIYFLPETVLALVSRTLAWPARRCTLILERDGTGARWPVALIAALVAVLVVLMGQDLDLPGASGAAFIGLAAVLSLCVVGLWRPDQQRRLQQITAVGLAAIALWVAVTASDARFHFYSFFGHTFVDSHDVDRRLQMHAKSLAYAQNDSHRAQAHNNLALACEQ